MIMKINQAQVLERIRKLQSVPSVEKRPYRILHTELAIPKHLQNVQLDNITFAKLKRLLSLTFKQTVCQKKGTVC